MRNKRRFFFDEKFYKEISIFKKLIIFYKKYLNQLEIFWAFTNVTSNQNIIEIEAIENRK